MAPAFVVWSRIPEWMEAHGVLMETVPPHIQHLIWLADHGPIHPDQSREILEEIVPLSKRLDARLRVALRALHSSA